MYKCKCTKYFINFNIPEINPSMIICLKILLTTPITFCVAIENEVVNILNHNGIIFESARGSSATQHFSAYKFPCLT